MKKIQIVQGAILALLFASAAQAETYDGVLQGSSVRSRADVDAEAATVAQKDDLYRSGLQSPGMSSMPKQSRKPIPPIRISLARPITGMPFPPSTRVGRSW